MEGWLGEPELLVSPGDETAAVTHSQNLFLNFTLTVTAWRSCQNFEGTRRFLIEPFIHGLSLVTSERYLFQFL